MNKKTIRIEEIPHSPDYRHLSSIDGIAIELRYATPDNFVGRNLYGDIDCAWLHREAAEALESGVAWLRHHAPGTGVLVLDALRPQRVQEELWDALDGTDLRMYLANPARGSIHSFGMAVDLTLVASCGKELDMGTPFDDLTELSHPALEEGFLRAGKLTEEQVANRRLLRAMMTHAGFVGINTEWWHFDCGDRERVRAELALVV